MLPDPLKFFAETFDHVVVFDAEWSLDRNGRPDYSVCGFLDLISGRRTSIWTADGVSADPPFSLEPNGLYLAYSGSGDLEFIRRYYGTKPARFIDLYAEYHCHVNNGTKQGLSALHAAMFFGLPNIETTAKTAGRALAMRGGPFTLAERIALTAYNDSDGDLEALIFESLMRYRLTGDRSADALYLAQALHRGEYIKAFSAMDWTGVPTKLRALEAYLLHQDEIIRILINHFDPDHVIWDEVKHDFNNDRFLEWVTARGIPSAYTEIGRPLLTKEYIKEQARRHTDLAPIAELRSLLRKIPKRKRQMSVGADGFTRGVLRPFRTLTSRDHADASDFVFLYAGWEKSRFVGPPSPDIAMALADYSAQEIGVISASSGDLALQAAYHSGDVHLQTAIDLGLAPLEADKESHKAARRVAKAINFAIIYGSGPLNLAAQISPTCTPFMASRYLLDHRAKYPQLHSWLDNFVRQAYARGFVQTICGWRMLVNDDTNPRTLRNFPAQANAAEVTRLAVILMVAAGLRPACSIHDAVLVLAPPDRIEANAALAAELMVEASRRLLDFELLVDPPEIVRWPNTLKGDDSSPILKFIDPFLTEEV